MLTALTLWNRFVLFICLELFCNCRIAMAFRIFQRVLGCVVSVCTHPVNRYHVAFVPTLGAPSKRPLMTAGLTLFAASGFLRSCLLTSLFWSPLRILTKFHLQGVIRFLCSPSQHSSNSDKLCEVCYFFQGGLCAVSFASSETWVLVFNATSKVATGLSTSPVHNRLACT